MNKFIRFLKNLSLLLYVVFFFIAIFFFAKGQEDLGSDALVWATGYIIAEYGFLSILKSRLLEVKQEKYKLVILYENRRSAEEMVKKIKEMNELQEFLQKPNVTSCHFMDYEVYHRLNPKLTISSFPYYLVINGEDLISDGLLLRKPLYHHSSKEDVIEFLSKHQ